MRRIRNPSSVMKYNIMVSSELSMITDREETLLQTCSIVSPKFSPKKIATRKPLKTIIVLLERGNKTIHDDIILFLSN